MGMVVVICGVVRISYIASDNTNRVFIYVPAIHITPSKDVTNFQGFMSPQYILKYILILLPLSVRLLTDAVKVVWAGLWTYANDSWREPCAKTVWGSSSIESFWRGDDRSSEFISRSDDRSSETVWRGDDRSSDRHFVPLIDHRKQFGGEMIALMTGTYFRWSIIGNSLAGRWSALSAEGWSLETVWRADDRSSDRHVAEYWAHESYVVKYL